MQNKDVVQVTWQKPEGEKTLATSSKPFGPRVNPDFIDKVEFKDAGLQNNSIVIRNLTEQDEGCYQCLFNSYPEGESGSDHFYFSKLTSKCSQLLPFDL
uniref:Immunoglobulin V-set domain-containing protein n=1 Tax=Dicentrarchus labrax TaxID=13489 RepID=A0A8C4GVE4_DICLA